MSDFGKGAIHGLLSLVGVGSVYDPVGDAQAAMSTAASQLQDTMNMNTYTTLQLQSQINSKFLQFVQTENAKITETIKQYEIVAGQQFFRENYFILIIGLLVLVMAALMII